MSRTILVILGFSALGLVASGLLPGPLAGGIFMALAVAFPVALAALGAARGPRGRAAVGLLAALGLLLEVAFFAMRALSGEVLDGPWIGGLPLPVAIQLGAVWLVPAVVVPFVYAWSFDGRAGDS